MDHFDIDSKKARKRIKRMDKGIFENIGKNIKVVAKVLFYLALVVGVIVTVVAFFIYLKDKDSLWNSDVVKALLARSVSIYGLIGTITGSISSLALYGFGEIVEDVHKIRTAVNANNSDTTVVDLPEL